MAPIDHKAKQLYDAVAKLIANLHVQKGRITQEEMYCLLSILDLIMQGKDDRGLIQVLRDWQAGEPNPEVDEIIKATLISTDFTKPAALDANLETLRDLIRYNKDLGATR